MERTDILSPMLALAALTFAVLTLLGVLRIGGVTSGRVSTAYYRLFRESENEESEFVRRVARNYHNLLEVPVLFYVGCLLAYSADVVSALLVALAWTYVAMRVAHTAIHIGYNYIWHRMPVFVASSLVLMAFWLVLGMAVLEQG